MFHTDYVSKIQSMASGKVIRHYVQKDRSGTAMKDYSPHKTNGTYNGPSLEGKMGWRGVYGPDYDGANDYATFLTDLDTDMNKSTNLTFIAWVDGNSGAWTTGIQNYIFWIGTDANGGETYFRMRADSTDWQIYWNLQADGAGESTTYLIPVADRTDYMCIGWTIDFTGGGDYGYYYNGTEVDTDSGGKTWTSATIDAAVLGAEEDTTGRHWYDGFFDFIIIGETWDDEKMRIATQTRWAA